MEICVRNIIKFWHVRRNGGVITVQILLYLVLVFSFNLIQTIGACAGSILAMPFAIALLGGDSVRVVVNAVGFVSFVYPLLRCYRNINWKEVIKIAVFMAIGVLLAQRILHILYRPEVLLLYSLLVIGAALQNFFIKKAVRIPMLLDDLVLLAAGLIHGAFLSGGALLILYSMSRLKGKQEQRGDVVLYLDDSERLYAGFVCPPGTVFRRESVSCTHRFDSRFGRCSAG